MKKLLFLVVIPAQFMLSCNRNECYECYMQGQNPETFKVCEEEFDDYQRFQQQIVAYETIGWDCNKIK